MIARATAADRRRHEAATCGGVGGGSVGVGVGGVGGVGGGGGGSSGSSRSSGDDVGWNLITPLDVNCR